MQPLVWYLILFAILLKWVIWIIAYDNVTEVHGFQFSFCSFILVLPNWVKIFYISICKMFRPVQTTKEISMKRQIFIFIAGIKLEEIICKISLWLQWKYVSNTKSRIRCSHFDNIHMCLSSSGFHFLVAAEVIAALWCSCYPQPFLTVNGWHLLARVIYYPTAGKSLPLMKWAGSWDLVSHVPKIIYLQICDVFVKRCKSLMLLPGSSLFY